MSPAIKCLILLAVVALFFITELIPLAITATAGAIACGFIPVWHSPSVTKLYTCAEPVKTA